jgi:YceI-like domain
MDTSIAHIHTRLDMAHRHSARTASSCALTTLGLLVATTAVLGQGVGRPPVALDTARVTIAGTSNIHAYTASTTSVRLTRIEFAESVTGPDFWDAAVTPGALQAFEIAIPAATLSSPKDGLDKNMHKALKVKEHADITFRLIRIEASPDAPKALRAVGTLQIAGVEKEVAFNVTATRKDATLAVHGQVPLLMTDFGIAPPKAMLGMLKTDPKVTVTFETVLAIPLT